MFSYEIAEELIYDYLLNPSPATQFGIKNYLSQQFKPEQEIREFCLGHKVWVFRLGEKLAFVLLKKAQHCTPENRKIAFYETVLEEYENMFEYNLEQFTEEFGEIDSWVVAKTRLEESLRLVLPEDKFSGEDVRYQYHTSGTQFVLSEYSFEEFVTR